MTRVSPVPPKPASEGEVRYPHALCDDALHGWERRERVALADGARKRTEVLWINPAAAEWMNVCQAAFPSVAKNQ